MIRDRPPATNGFQPVLTIRASVEPDEVPNFTREALREIRAYIELHHLHVEGPPFCLHHQISRGWVDVESGWPVSGAPGRGRIHSGALPASWLRRPDLPPHRTTEADRSAACAGAM